MLYNYRRQGGQIKEGEMMDTMIDCNICEAHPELPWPHNNCPGPGMPESNRVRALVYQRNQASAKVDELIEVLKQHEPHAGPYHTQCCWCLETMPDHRPNCLYQEALDLYNKTEQCPCDCHSGMFRSHCVKCIPGECPES